MVHCHAQRANIVHIRPTDDVDVVIELRTQAYAQHAQSLMNAGFVPQESLDHAAPLHRFARGDDIVDLMIPDRQTARSRYLGRPLISVPGAASALKRTITHELPDGTRIRLPDLAAALSLKGAAHQVPSANAIRHLQDAVTLLACAGPEGLKPTPSKSMRANLNHLMKCLEKTPEAWALTSPRNRILATQCLRTLRPDWTDPTFLGSTTINTTRRRRNS